jgi:DNA polymerase III subunit chi
MEIRFYHLQTTPEAQALPQISMKAWQAGVRIVIKASNDTHMNIINDSLWTFRADSFVPHGTKDDPTPERQPVWITTDDNNPNDAKTLILATGCTSEKVETYNLCCIFLNGQNETEIQNARSQWKDFKAKGHIVSYWQQTDKGWEKKA